MSETGSLLDDDWDVVIVGSGMGGANVARELAVRGHRVVLLEKGERVDAAAPTVDPLTPEQKLARGLWPHKVSTRLSDGAVRRDDAPLGCAVGGSTVHYAAALERMEPSDFGELPGVVSEWPISWAEFVPYYEAAEKLFGVGSVEKEVANARLSQWDREFMANLRRNGLLPKVLHVAIRYDDQCQECIGRICPRRCKADARVACVDPVLPLRNFQLIEKCDVQRINANATSVTGVVAKLDGRQVTIKGRMVVLAAGALHSAQLLLRSANEHWPSGLANRSGLVGRNLMFHAIVMYAIWSPIRLNRNGRQRKSVSVRDFYVRNGRRLGYVQSLGLEAARGIIAVYLKNILRKRGLRGELLLSLIVALPARVAERIFGTAVLFIAKTEDDPDYENRLMIDPSEPDGACIRYRITDDLKDRADELCSAFRRHLKPWRFARISSQVDLNYGHACGTCRFGDNPMTSVLDRDCKAHGIDNLYVADSSFFPRSGAVNPSLTIAANAIRVARAIAARLG